MHTYAADHLRSGRTVFPLVSEFATGRLTWWPQLGIGHYPVTAGVEPYDQEYFERFARDAETPLGLCLMQARVDFVELHYQGTLVDVGIGCGAFIERRQAHKRETYGYDVNPAGIKWLAARELHVDPYHAQFDAVSLWDVLEHIPDFQRLLANVRKWVFVSLPIFTDAEHVLRSKHFRPAEHCWHFTREGLLYAMKLCGFALVSASKVESDLGREDIGTFAFKRQA